MSHLLIRALRLPQARACVCNVLPVPAKFSIKQVGTVLVGASVIGATIFAGLTWGEAANINDSQQEANQSQIDADKRAQADRDEARAAQKRQEDATRPSTAEFTDPAVLTDRQDCSYRAIYDGLTLSGRSAMQRDETLWILVRPEIQPRFYFPGVRPISISTKAEGNWSQRVHGIGRNSNKDEDKRFYLYLVSADTNGTALLQAASQSKRYVKSIPGGVHIVADACVTRS